MEEVKSTCLVMVPSLSTSLSMLSGPEVLPRLRNLTILITSQTYGQTGDQVFVFNFGTHYSNGHLVISKKINRLQG